jgi:outer membrane murein-binding lipoprotein Lpp
MKNISLNTILLIGVAVLLTLQIEGCFHNSKPDSEYKKQIAEKDKQIEQVSTERNDMRQKYDSVISLLTKKDTVLIREYKTNTIKYEKIPDNIRNLSNEDLRRAITGY